MQRRFLHSLHCRDGMRAGWGSRIRPALISYGIPANQWDHLWYKPALRSFCATGYALSIPVFAVLQCWSRIFFLRYRDSVYRLRQNIAVIRGVSNDTVGCGVYMVQFPPI